MADKGTFPWKREIIGVFVLAAALFSLLSLYVSGMGWVGYYIRVTAMFLFGRTSPLMILILLYIAIRIIRNTHRSVSPLRGAGFGLVIVTGITLFHIFTVYRGYQLPPSISEELQFARSGQGSGVVGAVLMTATLTAFGLPGSYVILAASLIIGLTLWFHMSLVQLLKLVGRALKERFRKSTVGLRTQATLAWRQRQERRTEKKEQSRLAKADAKAQRQLAKKEERQGSVTATDPTISVNGAVQDDGRKPKKKLEKNGPLSAKVTREPIPASSRKDRSEAATHPIRTEEGTNAERARVPSPEPDGKIKVPKVKGGSGYHLPPLHLLNKGESGKKKQAQEDQSTLLEETFASFGIEATVVNVSHGPVITRYELQPARGIKVSKITGLADDIALSLAAADVRIEAPVPGKAVVGIEIPNKETEAVFFRDVLEDDAFAQQKSKVALALGKDIAGHAVVADLKKWLHLLVAGSTGSGKSVCLNSMIASILYKATPDEVKLLMIDPKRVELAIYDGVPHLISPVVTDPKKAAVALRWAVAEMERRYKLFEKTGVRNIDMYYEWMYSDKAEVWKEKNDQTIDALPYMVIVIDELADLMMVAAAEVEDAICRLAQMARAAGMYLIIATQRPSVDVITGLIKANVPSRIAFAVSSQVDSRTILDMSGAERLIGKGDMLYYPIGASKPIRAQGAWISDREIEALVEYWKQQGEPAYEESVEKPPQPDALNATEDTDELLEDAVRLVIDTGQASISMLQRRFRIGYSRAARLIDMMEVRGIVGSYQGSKPREVLVDSSDLEGVGHE